MRVLIVSCTFPPEPLVSAQTSVQIAEELVRRGHEVTVVTGFPNRPAGKLYAGYERRLIKREREQNGFELIRCFSFLSVKSSLTSRLMENLSFGLTAGYVALTTRSPDVIYSNTWPLIATGILSAVARLRGIRMVISIQDVYPESLISQGRLGSTHLASRCMRWIDGVIVRGAQKVIVISEGFARLYRRERGVDPLRLQVISNWADTGLITTDDDRAPMFRAVKNVPQNAFLILYGGNVGTGAGVDTIIKAFHHLRDIEHLYLVIAGQGSSVDACRELARELGNPRIIFHSPWEKDETSMVLASADVLILPTSGSQSLASLPSKLISYMLSGRPIIANADSSSDLATIIEESTCGWVVEPDNPELLASKIREVVTTDTPELVRRGKMGRAYALTNLTREVCLPRVIEVLERTSAKDGG